MDRKLIRRLRFGLPTRKNRNLKPERKRGSPTFPRLEFRLHNFERSVTVAPSLQPVYAVVRVELFRGIAHFRELKFVRTV